MNNLVVYDTNVWIAGLFWRGRAYQCILLARAEFVRLAYCSPMLSELSMKLRDPFGLSENHIQSILYELKRLGQRFEITGNLHAVPEDPDDDKFIECAIVSGASIVVSSDRHLLSLRQYETVRILTPAQFLDHFSSTRVPSEPPNRER